MWNDDPVRSCDLTDNRMQCISQSCWRINQIHGSVYDVPYEERRKKCFVSQVQENRVQTSEAVTPLIGTHFFDPDWRIHVTCDSSSESESRTGITWSKRFSSEKCITITRKLLLWRNWLSIILTVISEELFDVQWHTTNSTYQIFFRNHVFDWLRYILVIFI